MPRFAVIGNPINHSLSPLIHQHFAKQTGLALSYEKILGEELSFEQQVKLFFSAGGQGLNVTLPFKQRAFALASQKTKRCQLAKAANTLWMQAGQLHADNTDGIGLVRDLAHHLNLRGIKIALLGAGGAARGVLPALLAAHPLAIRVINRSQAKLQDLLRDFPQVQGSTFEALSGAFDLIINATSASLQGEPLILPEEIMAGKPFCYDLAYQQKGDTPFVRYAKDKECKAIDGLGMLAEQAAEAFYLWNGLKPETRHILSLLRAK